MAGMNKEQKVNSAIINGAKLDVRWFDIEHTYGEPSKITHKESGNFIYINANTSVLVSGAKIEWWAMCNGIAQLDIDSGEWVAAWSWAKHDAEII